MGFGWIQRVRVPLGFVFAVLYLVLARPSTLSLVFALPWIVLGELIRVTASGCIEKNRLLATRGPYAYVRHPLYLGSSLIVLGFALASNRTILAATLLGLFVLVYTPVMRREEQSLEDRFGDEFRAWRSRVPTVLPRVPGRDVFDGFAWSGVRRHREYRAALGCVALIVFLFFRIVD